MSDAGIASPQWPIDPPFVSFLSDYGRADEFVGVCHAVMLDIAPDLRIVDITHEIPPFDVRAGALALVRAIQYLPEGVVLAVVDPGVGTDRRCVAVEVENAALVGPDNGLLAPAVAMLGGPRRVVEITSPEHRLAAPGPDVRGPRRDGARGRVPRGRHRRSTRSGPEIDPGAAHARARAAPERRRRRRDHRRGAVGRPLRQLPAQHRARAARGRRRARSGDPLEITVSDAGRGARPARRARWVRTFADAKPSELVVLVDSYGMCTIALDRRSAAAELGLRTASGVTVATEPSAAPARRAGVPIGLGRKEPRP